MVNGGYDYEGFKRTLRPSALRLRSSSSCGGKGAGAMVAAEARWEEGLVSGAFNGSGARGLRIDAVGKDKGKDNGKEVGDNDQRGEKARRKEEGGYGGRAGAQQWRERPSSAIVSVPSRRSGSWPSSRSRTGCTGTTTCT